MTQASGAGGICRRCGAPLTLGARFCRGCGEPVAEPWVPRAAEGIADQVPRLTRSASNEVRERIRLTWGMVALRLPLVALGLTALGMFLPWADNAAPASGLRAAVFVLFIGGLMTAGLILYATLPQHPEWMLMTVTGAAFVIAVPAAVLLGVALLMAASSAAYNVSVGNVGIGVYVTTVGSVTLLLSLVRLLRRPDLE